MIKMIALVPRKADISREEFKTYYETRHVPLILSFFPQITRYIRNYSVGNENIHYMGRIQCGAIPYDAVTEIWFKDRVAYEDMMRMFASDPEKIAALGQDEAAFIDINRIIEVLVEECHSEL